MRPYIATLFDSQNENAAIEDFPLAERTMIAKEQNGRHRASRPIECLKFPDLLWLALRTRRCSTHAGAGHRRTVDLL